MRQSALNSFVDYNDDLEGVCGFMYLDRKGLVSSCIGLLLDPVALFRAARLPWKRPDGTLATREEAEAEWRAVKAMQQRRLMGGGHFRKWTSLRLTKGDILNATRARIELNETHLRERFPEWDSWPSDAQLGVMSVAWAVGATLKGYPRMCAALQARDFDAAAAEATFASGDGTYADRQAAQQLCLRNAAKVERLGLDPEVLWWPRKAPDELELVDIEPEGRDKAGGGMLAIEGIADAAIEACERDMLDD